MLDMLDGRRMRREVLKTQIGSVIKKVPVHMLCQSCHRKFDDDSDLKANPVSTQTDAISCYSSQVQTDPQPSDGFGPEVLESIIQRGNDAAVKGNILNGWRRQTMKSNWRNAADAVFARQMDAFEVHLKRQAMARLKPAHLSGPVFAPPRGGGPRQEALEDSREGSDCSDGPSGESRRSGARAFGAFGDEEGLSEARLRGGTASPTSFSPAPYPRQKGSGQADLCSVLQASADPVEGDALESKRRIFEAFRENASTAGGASRSPAAVGSEKRAGQGKRKIEDLLAGKLRQLQAYNAHIQRLALARWKTCIGISKDESLSFQIKISNEDGQAQEILSRDLQDAQLEERPHSATERREAAASPVTTWQRSARPGVLLGTEGLCSLASKSPSCQEPLGAGKEPPFPEDEERTVVPWRQTAAPPGRRELSGSQSAGALRPGGQGRAFALGAPQLGGGLGAGAAALAGAGGAENGQGAQAVEQWRRSLLSCSLALHFAVPMASVACRSVTVIRLLLMLLLLLLWLLLLWLWLWLWLGLGLGLG
ncbi:unnamed protein product [Polarella glacialis]|uniref:Uncharacterized protein n=1 Tax=Polarella glacialis TaxID=89957 RepID=A0A813JR87_POLGL|nr:unnamed protein product [Polarella glacialis]